MGMNMKGQNVDIKVHRGSGTMCFQKTITRGQECCAFENKSRIIKTTRYGYKRNSEGLRRR